MWCAVPVGDVVHSRACCVVHHTDVQVGIMFGNPETTAGGQALKFYASQRVDVRAKEKVKSGDGKVETGIRVKAKVVKNKVAPPYRCVLNKTFELVCHLHAYVCAHASICACQKLGCMCACACGNALL